jgi:hypothetical protein
MRECKIWKNEEMLSDKDIVIKSFISFYNKGNTVYLQVRQNVSKILTM